MISSRKLIKMARKWQRLAAMGRKQLTVPGKNEYEEASTGSHSSNSLAKKGQFIVYTDDKKRYAFPITYLNNYILRELLIMSEEEFGLPSHGPITLPCDAVFMDYAISLIQKKASKEVEKALLMSMAAYRCSSSYQFHELETTQHLMLCSC
ncbi:auxin-responsive SAUR68-like [Olea europaea subsp. europaea]|uniref:Auxin-responsive SAUR68-like n=1 Tax=Olea europaea subsp. europaea TaxID=158383 RepID=A0A8S0TJV8_OLEEU|nr:auxin-responsive SAUR68-like [Olea europaea subsp. europaea]